MFDFRRLVGCLLLAFAAASLTGCALFDPTYGMTPEEKAAYEVEQERLAAERELQAAAFEARRIPDLTTPGEPHDEARNNSLAGRYAYSWESDWTSLVLLKYQEGKRRKAESLTLFDNGSYARQLTADKRWGQDRKERDWSMDVTQFNEDIKRGQWKTEGNTFYVRDMAFNGGYGEWRPWGVFELTSTGFGLVDAPSAEAAARQLPEDASLEMALQPLADNTFNWVRQG